MSSTYNCALHRLGTQQMKIILAAVLVVFSALDLSLLARPHIHICTICLMTVTRGEDRGYGLEVK